MKNFIHDDFLLETDEAVRLYHEYAKDMPVIDYHNHLSPEDIASDRKFDNIADIWLEGDHYKWRAMRANGIDENLITGKSKSQDKFKAWAITMPKLLRNPLYHWTHLELARYFGIDDRLLNLQTSDYIYNKCNEMLQTDDFTTRSLLKRLNVEVLCTTDDPLDSLEFHKKFMSDDKRKFSLYPTGRPDKAMKAEDPQSLNLWIDALEESAGISISTYENYLEAIKNRHTYFHENGCRISDHGLETVYAEDYSDNEIKDIFSKIRFGKEVKHKDVLKFKSAMLFEFCLMNHSRNWTQQFHIGIIRNANSSLFEALGPDSGGDSIGDFKYAGVLAKLLNKLDSVNSLAKTIIYPANPADNDIIGTLIGSFQDGSVPGKMQFGSGWWFMDQKEGMLNQMNSLSNAGLLSKFIGMTTDSRSFLSFPRHEYFRRILCNLIGKDMSLGLIPMDFELTGSMIQDISYNNAKEYFGV